LYNYICAAKDFCINVFAGFFFSGFVEVTFQKPLTLISFCEELSAVAEDPSNSIVGNALSFICRSVDFFFFSVGSNPKRAVMCLMIFTGWLS